MTALTAFKEAVDEKAQREISALMPDDDKLNEARLEAGEILKLSQDEVVDLFYRETKQRRLGRLVHRLDRLALRGGEDARIAAAALRRLGFAVNPT